MKIAGLGNPGDTISVNPDRGKALIMGGLAFDPENIQAETEHDLRETATLKVKKEKRGRPRKK